MKVKANKQLFSTKVKANMVTKLMKVDPDV